MRQVLRNIWRLPLCPCKNIDGTDVLIALGSSLGDRKGNLHRGILHLMHDPESQVLRLSSVWQTTPVGAAKIPFYNMCLVLRTRRSPEDLMNLLLSIERKCDRLRGVHWMDRTLDLDIILYGSQVVTTRSLQIPHPRMKDRSFVMLPAVEIAGDWICPSTLYSLDALTEHSTIGMWRVGRFVIATL